MRHLAYACSAAALILAAAGGAQAQTITDAELATLVRQQAAEIDRLKQRLEALEAQSARPVATAPAYTPAAPVAAPVATASAEPRETFDWDDGAPQITSADGSVSFRMRGRALVDYSTTTGSDFGQRNISTTGVRALRVGVEGAMGENFFYQAELDIAEGEGEVKSAFIGWRDQFAGLNYDIRVGSMLNDRSMEYSTGNDMTPFIERNVVAQALAPQRGVFGVGVMGRVFGPNYHASLQLVGDDVLGSTQGNSSRDTLGVVTRAHWNPIKGPNHALHLGVWGNTERMTTDMASYSRNTDIGGRWNDNLTIALGSLPGLESAVAGGLELGGYNGPLWAFAEAGERTLHIREALGGGDVETKAWSLSGGWFLTGERSHYSARQGNFGGVNVRNPIDAGGMGALELLARYEDVDYSDAPLGGTGSAATLGANWYLTDISKIMLNIIQWETDNRAGAYLGEDKGTTVTVRAQVSF
jgi:phosphate-selective porin OprO and OprP